MNNTSLLIGKANNKNIRHEISCNINNSIANHENILVFSDNVSYYSDFLRKLNEEEYNKLVANTTAKATTIKTLVSSIVKINNAQFSISIYDGKYISAVALDLDVELNFAASLEIFPSDTSIKLKASASSEISLLDANYTITYPEDMESWLPAPDTGDNTTSK